MKRHYLTYVSKALGTDKQIKDCLNEYREFTTQLNEAFAIRCTFFVAAQNNDEYSRIKNIILHQSKDVFFYPTIIGQAPIEGEMAIECVVIDRSENGVSIDLRTANAHPYILLSSGENKKVLASGLCGDINSSIKEQSKQAFESLEAILKAEGLEFSDIVRQWNYIENITQTTQLENKTFQHYQIFNDVRSLFYAKADFNLGYPAATGIGQDSGGIILEIIAAKGPELEIIPIDNPEQISAHNYSEKVLVGKEIKEFEQKSTPKFERAKYVKSPFARTLFISGTAAIRGENTIPNDDIIEQTQITIENMQKLEYSNSATHNYSMFRLYVKDPKQGPISYAYAKKHFKSAPGLQLKGPVCRDNLVVEIEAEKELS